ILKVVKVLCFDTLLQVFILKGLTTRMGGCHILCQAKEGRRSFLILARISLLGRSTTQHRQSSCSDIGLRVAVRGESGGKTNPGEDQERPSAFFRLAKNMASPHPR